MKVRVDPTKCQGYGLCTEVAGEVFKLDDFGFAHVEGGTEITPEMEPRVAEAVRGCPAKAIVSDA
jgi:ferredoxin